MRISDWSSDVCSSDLQSSVCQARRSAVRRSRATFLPQLRLGVNRFGLDRIFDGTPGGGVAELDSRRLGRVLAVAMKVADRGQVDALEAAAEERLGDSLIEQNDKCTVQRQRELEGKTNYERSEGPVEQRTSNDRQRG